MDRHGHRGSCRPRHCCIRVVHRRLFKTASRCRFCRFCRSSRRRLPRFLCIQPFCIQSFCIQPFCACACVCRWSSVGCAALHGVRNARCTGSVRSNGSSVSSRVSSTFEPCLHFICISFACIFDIAFVARPNERRRLSYPQTNPNPQEQIGHHAPPRHVYAGHGRSSHQFCRCRCGCGCAVRACFRSSRTYGPCSRPCSR